MILVQGQPPDMTALSSQYNQNSVEWLVLQQMSQSSHTYRFNSLSLLQFELQLRSEIVAAAQALNRSGLAFAIFTKTRCNETYWKRMPNGGFLLREGASPAQAIRDIYQNGRKYATECATAMMIVYYRALLEVYGEERFDQLFPSIYLMNWSIRNPLLQEVGTPKKVPELLYGDRGYFANPDVDPETPQWQGENVIVLPGGKYYGHGIGIASADQIIRALNGNRREDSTQTAYLMDSAGRPNFARLAKQVEPIPAPMTSLVWRPFPAAIST